MKKQWCSFEQDYFKAYYEPTSDFTKKAFNKNFNWFRGIFHSIHRYTNVLDGRGKTAIEFGCAHGAASRVLRDAGYAVTATDVSSYALTRAKKLTEKIRFLKQDVQKPLKKAERYDLVLCLDVIEHLENPARAIKNFHKIVKQHGWVICSTPNDYEYARNVFTHINVKKPHQWRRIFRKAGFNSIHIVQLSFLPFFYRFHWRLNFSLPIAIDSPHICSPVFIFAKKSV